MGMRLTPQNDKKGFELSITAPVRGKPVLQAAATTLVGALLLLPIVFSGHPAVRIFTLMYVGILMEALPFMLLGSCISGLLEVYVSRERLLPTAGI